MKLTPCSAGFGCQCPPDETHVRVYFLQHGSTPDDSSIFFNHYGAKGWANAKGHRLRNWKRLAWTWIFYK